MYKLSSRQRPLVVVPAQQQPPLLQPSQSQHEPHNNRRRRKVIFKQRLMSVNAAMIARSRVPEDPGVTTILEFIGKIASVLKAPTPTQPAIVFLVRGEEQEHRGGGSVPIRVEYWGGSGGTDSNFSVLVGKLCRFIGTVTSSTTGRPADRTFLAYWVAPDVSENDVSVYKNELKKTEQFISSK